MKIFPGTLLACIWFAVPPALAQALPREPPSQVYMPGDQSTFQDGVDAFDAGDYARAYGIFSYLADHDDIAALRNVAFMERRGLGTAKDPNQALQDYKVAAAAGLPTACADLGEMLLTGEAGAPDPQAALPWLTKAAAANHPMAQYLLGTMYEKGEAVPRDAAKAKELYEAAAARGVDAAAARLAALAKTQRPPEAGAAGP
jgi:TPR repeat protein